MNYRTTKLLAVTDLGGAGTKTIDIRVKEHISRIQLQWGVMKSVSFMHSYCHADISKIELVDGSEVLFSLNGGQAQALNIYDRKVGSMNYGLYISGNEQFSYYGIDFGRYLWDPMLAFDPTKFNNPQLKVTFDETISDTGGSDGKLQVVADVFDEKIIAPIGFLMSKVHHAYAPGSDGSYEYIKMPTDYPYRKILVQGYAKNISPRTIIKEVRLNEDNEKRIPFDWEMWTYNQHMMGINQPVLENFITQLPVGPVNYYLTPTNYWARLILQNGAPADAPGVPYEGAGGTFAITTTAGEAPSGIAHGYNPNHCFQFPFGDTMDIDDWYDVSRIGDLELRLRAGHLGEGEVGAVVLQQLRRY